MFAATTPVDSPEPKDYTSDDLDDVCVEVDNALIDECHATVGTSNVINLIAKHDVRYKLSPDAKFATSPVNIKDKHYDFSLDLSYISLVEEEPFLWY